MSRSIFWERRILKELAASTWPLTASSFELDRRARDTNAHFFKVAFFFSFSLQYDKKVQEK